MSNDSIRKRPRPTSPDDFIGQAEDQASMSHQGPGRPPLSKEKCRLKAFHLPLSLIEKIEHEAGKTSGGNASALARKIFDEFFGKEEGVDK